MNIITKKTELSTVIEKLKSEGKTVGLVPTMGALHEGHISLVKACKKGNDIAVVSVFVNPTQFNDKEDLKRYPRTLDKDVALLEKNGCDYVFAPSVEEMYPEEDTRVFNFGYVESVMEGAKRPGHFNGVGQIVSKLFDIVRPHRAYFGMKDFQHCFMPYHPGNRRAGHEFQKYFTGTGIQEKCPAYSQSTRRSYSLNFPNERGRIKKMGSRRNQ